MSASESRVSAVVFIRTLLVVWIALVGGTSFVAHAGQEETKLPEGEAKPIVERSCTACHGLELITTVKLSKDMWRDIVLEMQTRGADLREKEVPLVIDYLAQHFGEPEKKNGTSADLGVIRR